jgi:hypothetical protein
MDQFLNRALDFAEKSVVEKLQSAAIELVDESFSEYPTNAPGTKPPGSSGSTSKLGSSSALDSTLSTCTWSKTH